MTFMKQCKYKNKISSTEIHQFIQVILKVEHFQRIILNMNN